MPDFSSRLKQLRKDKGLTQVDMTSLLKCTSQHYQRIEYGDVNIPYKTLLSLADFFGVSIDYLVGRSNNPNGGGSSLPPMLLCIYQHLLPESQLFLTQMAEQLLETQRNLLTRASGADGDEWLAGTPPQYKEGDPEFAACENQDSEIDSEIQSDFETIRKLDNGD